MDESTDITSLGCHLLLSNIEGPLIQETDNLFRWLLTVTSATCWFIQKSNEIQTVYGCSSVAVFVRLLSCCLVLLIFLKPYLILRPAAELLRHMLCMCVCMCIYVAPVHIQHASVLLCGLIS